MFLYGQDVKVGMGLGIPKINPVTEEFFRQIVISTIGHNFVPQDTFIENFCFTVKALTKVVFDNVINKPTNSVVSFKEVFKGEVSDGFIGEVNVLNFLEITNSDFKSYLDDKMTLSQICKYFKIQRYIKLN